MLNILYNILKIFTPIILFSSSAFALGFSITHPLFEFNLVLPFYIERLFVEAALYVTSMVSEIFYRNPFTVFAAFFVVKFMVIAIKKAEEFSFHELFSYLYVSNTNNIIAKLLLYYFALNSFLAPATANLYSMGGTIEEDNGKIIIKNIHFEKYKPILTKDQIINALRMQSIIPVTGADAQPLLVAPMIAIAPAAIFARYVYGAPQDQAIGKNPIRPSIILAPVIGEHMQMMITNPTGVVSDAINSISGSTPSAKVKIIPSYYTSYNLTVQENMISLRKANRDLKQKLRLDYKKYLQDDVFRPIFSEFVVAQEANDPDKSQKNAEAKQKAETYTAEGGNGVLNAALIFANYSNLLNFDWVVSQLKDAEPDGDYSKTAIKDFMLPDSPIPFANEHMQIGQILTARTFSGNDILNEFVGQFNYSIAFDTFVNSLFARKKYLLSPFSLYSGETINYTEARADDIFLDISKGLKLPGISFEMFQQISKPYFLDIPGTSGSYAPNTMFSEYFFKEPNVLRRGFKSSASFSSDDAEFHGMPDLVFHDGLAHSIDNDKALNTSYKDTWELHMALLMTDYWLTELYRKNASAIRNDLDAVSSWMNRTTTKETLAAKKKADKEKNVNEAPPKNDPEAVKGLIVSGSTDKGYLTEWGVAFSEKERDFTAYYETDKDQPHLTPLRVLNPTSELLSPDQSRFDWIHIFSNIGVEAVAKLSSAVVQNSNLVMSSSPAGELHSSNCYVKPRFSTSQKNAIKTVAQQGANEITAFTTSFMTRMRNIFEKLSSKSPIDYPDDPDINAPFYFYGKTEPVIKTLLPATAKQDIANNKTTCVRHSGGIPGEKVIIATETLLPPTTRYIANVPELQQKITNQLTRHFSQQATGMKKMYDLLFTKNLYVDSNQVYWVVVEMDRLNAFSFFMSRSPELYKATVTPLTTYGSYGHFIERVFSGTVNLAVNQQALTLLFSANFVNAGEDGKSYKDLVNSSGADNVYSKLKPFTTTLFDKLFGDKPIVPHIQPLVMWEWTQQLVGVFETVVGIAFQGNFLNSGKLDFMQEWFNVANKRKADDVKKTEQDNTEFVAKHPWQQDTNSEECDGDVNSILCSLTNVLAMIDIIAPTIPFFGSDSSSGVLGGVTDGSEIDGSFFITLFYNALILVTIIMMANFYIGSLILFTSHLFTGIINWSTVFIYRFFDVLTNHEKTFNEVIPETLLGLKAPFLSLSGVLFFSVLLLVMNIAFATLFEILVLIFGQYGESAATSLLFIGGVFVLFWGIFGAAGDWVAKRFESSTSGATGLFKIGVNKVVDTIGKRGNETYNKNV